MICFSKNDISCQLWLGWKGLVRMICFSKNEDCAELFTQWMDFRKLTLKVKRLGDFALFDTSPLTQFSKFKITLKDCQIMVVFQKLEGKTTKIHSLSKQFCTIFILWKTYHSHQTFPTCQSWHQLFILWKTYHCAELFTQWMGFSPCITRKILWEAKCA